MSVSAFNRRWAVVILEALTRHDVQHICIAPGSRSTPLTLAAENRAFIHHIHFDEGGLGHLAPGLAKANGQPVAVIVTSGTATANFYLALIEAGLTGEKLILLTADRPPELIDCGANQTLRQPGMFASHSSQTISLPRPSQDIPASWLISTLDQALGALHSGGVHINCPVAEPLYGDMDDTGVEWQQQLGCSLTSKRVLQWLATCESDEYWQVDNLPGRQDSAHHRGRRLICHIDRWLELHPAEKRQPWAVVIPELARRVLHAVVEHGQSDYPWLVFLHGFSGDAQEWQAVGEAFPDYSRLYIDLPGHGGSADISVNGFDDVSDLLRNTLLSYNILNYWLVGYSLGGRVAMMAACQGMPGLCGLVVEGGHPGLQHEDERVQRRLSDGRWAARFRREPLHDVFNDWYQQPVFASLDMTEREALVALRCQNKGETLAAMLEATSLAVQPDLRVQLKTRTFPFYYLCGERDDKFRALAAELSVPNHVIRNAGHNAHRENPAGVVDCLAQILRR